MHNARCPEPDFNLEDLQNLEYEEEDQDWNNNFYEIDETRDRIY